LYKKKESIAVKIVVPFNVMHVGKLISKPVCIAQMSWEHGNM